VHNSPLPKTLFTKISI